MQLENDGDKSYNIENVPRVAVPNYLFSVTFSESFVWL